MQLEISSSLSGCILTSLFIFILSCTNPGGTQQVSAAQITPETLLDLIEKQLAIDPGLQKGNIQEDISTKIIAPLRKTPYVLVPNTNDKQDDMAEYSRILSVNFQHLLETVLANLMEKQNSIGEKKTQSIKISMVFHTLQPPTPFRIPPNDASSLSGDDHLKDTVLARTISMRKLAQHNEQMGVDDSKNLLFIYNIYPKSALFSHQREGLKSITEMEETTYNKTLERFKSIIDCPITDDVKADSLEKVRDKINRISGATYLITTSEPRTIFFSIQGQQANEKTTHSWNIWLGSLSQSNSPKHERTLVDDRYWAIRDFVSISAIDERAKSRIMSHIQTAQ